MGVTVGSDRHILWRKPTQPWYYFSDYHGALLVGVFFNRLVMTHHYLTFYQNKRAARVYRRK